MTSKPKQKPIKRRIKEAILEILKNKTFVGDNVKISASLPTQEKDLPVILIYSLTGSSERFNQSPKNYRRVLNVTIEAIVQGNNDDDLDLRTEALGESIESLMEATPYLGIDEVSEIELTGEVYETSQNASAFTGRLGLTFGITFYTDAIRPDSVCYDNFEQVNVSWRKEPEVNADDQINLEQEENE